MKKQSASLRQRDIRLALLQIARIVAMEKEPDFVKILKLLAESYDADRGYFYLSDYQAKKFVMKFEWLSSAHENHQSRGTSEIPWDMARALYEPLSRNLVVYVKDRDTHPGTNEYGREYLARKNARSSIAVPVFLNENTLFGFLGISRISSPLMLDEGDISLLKVVAEIIADHLRKISIEKECASMESNFWAVVESTSSAIFIYQGHKHIYANAAAERITGYTREELYAGDILQFVHEDHRDLIKSRAMDRAMGKYVPDRYEMKIVHKSGKPVWLDISATTITLRGQPAGLIVALDVTERKEMEKALKQSEEKYRSLVENANAAIFITEYPSGIIISTNKMAEELTGRSSNELTGVPLSSILAREETDTLESRFLGIEKEENRRLFLKDVRVVRKDGTVIYVDITSNLFENEEKAYTVSIFKDITERKLTEEKLRQAVEESEKLHRMKNEFLANISHDLRTPISTITTSLELAMLEKNPYLLKKNLNVAVHAAKALSELVDDIIDFTALQEGIVTTEKQIFSPLELIQSVKTASELNAEEKKLKLETSVSKSVPEFLLGDSRRIKQVLMNLVSNAIKFTDTGKIRITVRQLLRKNKNAEAPPGRSNITVRFSVRDTGIGIAREEQKKIFEKFYQVDSALSRKNRGTGLGLSIAKSRVELMGGTIGVKSSPGKGSCFFFDLTLEKPSRAQIEKHLCLAENNSMLLKNNYDARILLVEDNSANRKLLKLLLEQHGIKVLTAPDGKKALKLIKKNKIDLILMDIQMPELDGFQTTKKIREIEKAENRKPVPVIALTAHVTENYRELCLKEGLDDYISKPLTSESLFVTLEKWLEKKIVPEKKRYVSGRNIAEKLLPDFLINLGKDLARLQCAFRKGDYSTIREIGHTLKGNGEMFGFKSITREGRALEKAALLKSNSAISSSIERLTRIQQEGIESKK